MRVLTQVLVDALKAVSPVVATKSTLPIIECVLLEVSPQSAVLTGTNLMNTVKKRIGIMPETSVERWQVAIPFVKFNAVVSTLDGVETNVTFDHNKLILRLACGKTVSTLKCQDASEYPAQIVPEMENEGDSVDLTSLFGALAGVGYAASSDGARVQLSGVYIDVAAGRAVATDGYRLAIADFDNSELAHLPNVLIPNKSLRQLKASGVNPAEAQIEVLHNAIKEATGLAIWDSSTLWHTQLVAQSYVDYSSLIEAGLHDSVTLLRDDLVTALATMAAMKRSGSDYMTLWQDGDILRMFARGDEIDSKLALPIGKVRGRGLEGQVSCNIDYLLGAIKAESAPELVIAYKNDPSLAVGKLIVTGAYSHTIVPMNVPHKLDITS